VRGLGRLGRQIAQTVRGASTAPRCAECERLRQENEQLRQAHAAQRDEIARLRQQLEDAQRRGKRQAAPFSKGPPKKDPNRPGRKAGTAYGLKARRPVPDHVDETYAVPLPPGCPDCGGAVIADQTVHQHQEELPPVKPIIRRFEIELGHCVKCHRRVRGRHPLQTSDALGAAGVHLGPAALALAASLNKHYGIPFGKVRDLFRTAFSLPISRGGLSQALARVAGALAPTYDALVAQVRRAPVVAADETGWKVGGELEWLWAFVTPQITVYRIMDGRGYEEACAVLGADFTGTLLRDGWAPYRSFEHATHQTCIGGHLIRRCQGLLETAQRGAARVPHAVLRIFDRALALRDHRIAQPPTPRGRAIHAGLLTAEMDRLLAWSPTDEANRKLLKHLRHERDALFTFLRDPRVPASNWWGEQAIRPAVVTRKVWGGNRTAAGTVTQYTLASFLRTCSQQRADPAPLIALVLHSPVPLIAPLPAFASGP
jgi:transposase